MAEEQTAGEEDAPKKKSRLPLLIGMVLALALGGGGFYSVYTGMLLTPPAMKDHEGESDSKARPLPQVAFVPVDPLVINLGGASASRHLKFRAELEVEPAYESEVSGLLPRVTDVLNGYLRAVSVSELQEPTALIKLRAQMLRRIQIVTGEGRVRDLLIMEFVLN